MSKNVRVKVIKSYDSPPGMNIDVFISERNVSQYEGNINITLTNTNQFIELQGGASSGCPDVKGDITYSGNKISFAACNTSFPETWFSLTGKDGKEQYHYFPYDNDVWEALIDTVKFVIRRLPDGDGCKLYQMYVG